MRDMYCEFKAQNQGFSLSEPLANIDIKGKLVDFSVERSLHTGIAHYYIEIIEEPSQCLNDISRSFCNPFPKEEDNMTVKIKKEPREVTIEELKEMDEFEKITFYLNQDKIKEVSERYGLSTCFPSDYKITFTQADLMFTEHYICVDEGIKKISYEFIEKIEVVEF